METPPSGDILMLLFEDGLTIHSREALSPISYTVPQKVIPNTPQDPLQTLSAVIV